MNKDLYYDFVYEYQTSDGAQAEDKTLIFSPDVFNKMLSNSYSKILSPEGYGRIDEYMSLIIKSRLDKQVTPDNYVLIQYIRNHSSYSGSVNSMSAILIDDDIKQIRLRCLFAEQRDLIIEKCKLGKEESGLLIMFLDKEESLLSGISNGFGINIKDIHSELNNLVKG